MQEIKCPHCGEVFQVDEAGYAAIVKQVRDKEFAREVERRETAAVELAVSKAEQKKEKERQNRIGKGAARAWRKSRDKAYDRKARAEKECRKERCGTDS